MYRDENFRKIAKIFILVFLCSEMQSSLTQPNVAEIGSKFYKTRFYNESIATEQLARHQASIRLIANDHIFGEGHICAGAIVAPSVVLTVAHCLHNYNRNVPHHPSELRVVMGSLDRYQRKEATLVYGVTHVYRPKTFDATTLRDNIAILMLERDIPDEHPIVQPIRLPNPKTVTQGPQNSGMSSDTQIKVTSWGVDEAGLPLKTLLALNATELKNDVCRRSFGRRLFMDTGMLCIGLPAAEITSICPADAGAALVQNDMLLGLSAIDSGVGCAAIPSIYTDVAHYTSWIMDKVGDGSNQNSSIWGTLAFLLFTAYTLKISQLMKTG